jgi:DNA-binding IclR family transcriptional regulator
LQQIRAQRYSTDDEEYFAGLVCVAVPVRDGARRTCAALAVHAPMSRMPLARQLEYLPALKRAAEQIARTFIE